MSKTRLEKWTDPQRTNLFKNARVARSASDPEIDELIRVRTGMDLHPQDWQGVKSDHSLGLFGELIATAKELIFDMGKGYPVLHIMNYIVDTHRFELGITHMWTISEGITSDPEWLKFILSMALVLDVPVYPNTDEVAPELARYHRDLLRDGFVLKDLGASPEAGENKRLVLTNSAGERIDSLEYFASLPIYEMHTPAELFLIKEAVTRELARHEEAGRVLASLRLAISELASLLESTVRNENALQDCLTRNPILFGPEYTRILPKHQLGAEYEMDYALERVSGLVGRCASSLTRIGSSWYNQGANPLIST